jgi:CRISPR/Cas system CSM-associated protein Csm2 small subunit
VGKNWTDRFVEKHSDAIKMSWSRPLETKRGRAVNPFTKEAFYKILDDTVKKYDITEERMFGTDEIVLQGSMGMLERVMGACKLGPQYQQ